MKIFTPKKQPRDELADKVWDLIDFVSKYLPNTSIKVEVKHPAVEFTVEHNPVKPEAKHEKN